MRLRKIKKIGGSFCIHLLPSDLVDLDLNVNDFVDISDINKVVNDE